jgi:hypothetical protein
VQLFLPWKSNKYYIFRKCDCSLGYPACNTHAPYCCLWPARLYNSSKLCHKRHDLKKSFEYKTCVLIFSKTSVFFETFLILRRVEILSKMDIGLHVKYPLFLSDCNATLIFSTDIQKILKYQIS